MERESQTPSSWCDPIEERRHEAKTQWGQVSEGSKEKGRGKVTHARAECRMAKIVSVLMLISMYLNKETKLPFKSISMDECERIIVIRSVAIVLVATVT